MTARHGTGGYDMMISARYFKVNETSEESELIKRPM